MAGWNDKEKKNCNASQNYFDEIRIIPLPGMKNAAHENLYELAKYQSYYKVKGLAFLLTLCTY